MSAAPAIERLQWRAPAPLWSAAADGRTDATRPAILRFAADDLVDRLNVVFFWRPYARVCIPSGRSG